MGIANTNIVDMRPDGNADAPDLVPNAGSVSLTEQQLQTLKQDDTFIVSSQGGDFGADGDGPGGLFLNDTRHLSRLSLQLCGAVPMLLNSAVQDDNALLTCDMTNPEFQTRDGMLAMPRGVIHIRRTRFLWDGACHERLLVRNFGQVSQRLSLRIGFGADFADLFEVRGQRRDVQGVHHHPDVADGGVKLAYTGLDRRRRTTDIRFEPAPTELAGDEAVFDFTLGPRGRAQIFLTIACDRPALPAARREYHLGRLAAARALRRLAGQAAAIQSSNALFDETARRSVADLYMLVTQTPDGPFPYAGIPWFSTVFGRDAILTALMTLWLDPRIALGVLRHLAATQAKTEDPAADAEPGKIVHEQRNGEMALLGEVPYHRYYGTIDATPLFVMLAAAYFERTADRDAMAELWPAIEAALDWITRYGDRDQDGFVEYGRRTSEGLVNQGWKDSGDSVFHADGRTAQGPIALCEVQSYVYGAWKGAAEICRSLGRTAQAADLDARAADLRRRFDEAFWDEELGCYVLALDGAKRPCRVKTSNAGHVLLSGLALPERAARLAATLADNVFFSGWGIRTLAADEVRFNPMSYHNGSVWPHDNALIAAGLARYGFKKLVARLFEGMFDAAGYIDLHRLPELFCGFARSRAQGPTFYPVACSPQAWAAVTPLSLLASCLGLRAEPEAGRFVFDQPVLPRFLDEVVLRRLALQGDTLSVVLKRDGENIVLQYLEESAELDAAVLT